MLMNQYRALPRLEFQHHCDVCKVNCNILVVKIPECIYFCIECASEYPDEVNFGWWTLEVYNEENVNKFKKMFCK